MNKLRTILSTIFASISVFISITLLYVLFYLAFSDHLSRVEIDPCVTNVQETK